MTGQLIKALYHLAADHPKESDRRYTSNLTAPMADGRWPVTDLEYI
jgi:hypothetical protein